MEKLFKWMAVLMLMVGHLVVRADDSVIMSNSDAASMISDRYAKKNNISRDAARRELVEEGVFKNADGAGSRTAAAKPTEAAVRVASTPTSQVIVPITTNRTDKSTAKVAVVPIVVADNKVAENKPLESKAKTQSVAPVVVAHAVPDATTVLIAAAPVVLSPTLSGTGFVMWPWLTLLLLIPMMLLGWFKRQPKEIVAAAPTVVVSNKVRLSAFNVNNLSFYVPVTFDDAPIKIPKNQMDSNVVLGFNFKTPLNRLHQMLLKTDEIAVDELESVSGDLNLASSTSLKRNVVLPSTLANDFVDETVASGRSRQQPEGNRLFVTQFKTPTRKLRDLVSVPASTLTQIDV